MSKHFRQKARSLKELRDEIVHHVPLVDRAPYSHNIIGFLLREVADRYGKREANRIIREEGLVRLGWDEQ